MATEYPVAVRREALRLFLLDESHAAIAQKLGVGVNTVSRWAAREGWLVERNRIAEEARQLILAECADIKLVNMREVMLNDLDVAAGLNLAVQKHLKDEFTGNAKVVQPRDLDSLAKAAKNASDIATRVVGINADDGNKGNSMTVNVAIAGQMAEAANVTVEG